MQGEPGELPFVDTHAVVVPAPRSVVWDALRELVDGLGHGVAGRVAPIVLGTEPSATTYAAFPGLHGRAYRALVIGSGLHVVATRRMLEDVRRRAERRRRA